MTTQKPFLFLSDSIIRLLSLDVTVHGYSHSIGRRTQHQIPNLQSFNSSCVTNFSGRQLVLPPQGVLWNSVFRRVVFLVCQYSFTRCNNATFVIAKPHSVAVAISGYSHTQFCNTFQVVIQANNIFFCNQSVMGGLILCSAAQATMGCKTLLFYPKTQFYCP